MTDATLTSWGRYPFHPQTPRAVHWRGELATTVAQLAATHGTTLAYGNGRSYGDSCLAASGHVLHTRSLDRFINADWQTGIVIAEAGVLLDELLALAVPRGWFPPVTPGTKYVTLGGAVANDVHGKNHHVRGTFGNHVRRFGLMRSDGSSCICSANEHAELFAATIGGLGLTGIIEWVELQLMPIRSSAITTTTIRFESLAEFFALSREFDGTHEYTVAWVDCLAQGRHAGRGVFFAGNHADDGSLEVTTRRKLAVPFAPPVSAINRLSLRAFNSAYYRLHRPGKHAGRTDYEPFFYPLDRILQWNLVYGPKGFQQYQCVVPDHHAESAMHELLSAIASSGNGSFLAVLKKCGDVASPGLLSFPLPGVSLALDFPQNDFIGTALFPRLDAIVREAGGRIYPAKDAHMSGADFRAFYPNWERLDALRDPALCSRFWKRVTTS
jgi:FAD/FMN-containing dehydrogenase